MVSCGTICVGCRAFPSSVPKKHHDNAVTLSLTTPEFKAIVGAHAIVMTEPFFPPPEWMIWILAVLGGLFFGLSTVFVAGYLDRSLDTPGAAERELGLPVLATIQNERSSKKPRGRKKRR
jgi:capsular polysaccharide biosynthesis protein